MGSNTRRKALADADWDSIIESRAVIVGDFKPHSKVWNVHCRERREQPRLERLVDDYELILNNKPGKATQPTHRKKTSIIDLIITTVDIGALNT